MENGLKLNLQLFAEEAGGESAGESSNDYDSFFNDFMGDPWEEPEENDNEPATDEDGAFVDGAQEDTPKEETPPDPEGAAGEQPFKNEVNAQFAYQRRQQEEAARVEQASIRAQDELIARMYGHQVNPYTGNHINTLQEYEAYQQRYQVEQMKEAGVDPALLERMISQHPAVRQSQEMLRQQQIAAGQAELQKQMQELAQIDPEIKSVGDLQTMPNFGQFNELVNRGYSLPDAYKLANFDKLTQKRQEATKQATLNQVNNKSHMKATNQGGGNGNAVVVPPDVAAMYREMMPELSEKEIAKAYARTLK